MKKSIKSLFYVLSSMTVCLLMPTNNAEATACYWDIGDSHYSACKEDRNAVGDYRCEWGNGACDPSLQY